MRVVSPSQQTTSIRDFAPCLVFNISETSWFPDAFHRVLGWKERISSLSGTQTALHHGQELLMSTLRPQALCP